MSSITNEKNPPVVCVVSRNSLRSIIFPSHEKNERTGEKDLLVNALGSITKDIDQLHGIATSLLVLLNDTHKFRLTFPYSRAMPNVPKRLMQTLVFRIEMDILCSMASELKADNEQKDAKIAELEAKLLALQPKKSLTVCVCCEAVCFFPCIMNFFFCFPMPIHEPTYRTCLNN